MATYKLAQHELAQSIIGEYSVDEQEKLSDAYNKAVQGSKNVGIICLDDIILHLVEDVPSEVVDILLSGGLMAEQ